jgi:hypothetical protein
MKGKGRTGRCLGDDSVKTYLDDGTPSDEADEGNG